jgi:hypothetical protein
MTLTISWNSAEETAAGEAITTTSVEHVLAFDAVTTETHETGSTLTEHAVESGAPISDHKRPNQRKITIEAIVTNTPIGTPPLSGFGPSPVDFSERKSEAAGATVRVFTARFDRMTDALDTLDLLATTAITVTISTRVRTYEACQIVSVSAPRSAEDGDSLRFTIEARQVRIAEALRVDVPRPREPRGQDRASAGTQATAEVEAPPESVLARGLDSLRESVGL